MFKGRYFDRSVILLCVGWYLAYNLSPRDLEEMIAERGISVDHITIHRWTVHYAPLLLEQFNRRKRPVKSTAQAKAGQEPVQGRLSPKAASPQK
jgi:putative transposase